MTVLPQDRLDQLVKRFALIEAQMAGNPDSETYVRLASEYSELEARRGQDPRAIGGATRGGRSAGDARRTGRPTPRCVHWRRPSFPTSRTRIEELEGQMQILLLPKDAADEKSAILEIRAGTGGSEAALFAGDLFRMYERYASDKGWRSRCCRPARARRAATRRSSPRFRDAACSPG